MPEPDGRNAAFVSTGALPARSRVRDLVDEAHGRYRADRQGRVSQVYPALAGVPADLFGVCVVGVDGAVYCAGDMEYEFAIMSVSEPFAFALVCELIGAPGVRDMVGVNGTPGFRSTRWPRSSAARTVARTRW
jgi:glutaminase